MLYCDAREVYVGQQILEIDCSGLLLEGGQGCAQIFQHVESIGPHKAGACEPSDELRTVSIII